MRRSEKPPGYWLGNVFYSDAMGERALEMWLRTSDAPAPGGPQWQVNHADLPDTWRWKWEDTLPSDCGPPEDRA